MKIRMTVKEDMPELALLYKQFWNEDSSIELMESKFIDLQKNPTIFF